MSLWRYHNILKDLYPSRTVENLSKTIGISVKHNQLKEILKNLWKCTTDVWLNFCYGSVDNVSSKDWRRWYKNLFIKYIQLMLTIFLIRQIILCAFASAINLLSGFGVIFKRFQYHMALCSSKWIVFL